MTLPDQGPVARPDGAPLTFVCPDCDMVLWDGVDYATCPACDTRVVWVDVTIPVWCCATCEAMVNAPLASAPACIRCRTSMARVHGHDDRPRRDAPRAGIRAVVRGLGAACLAIQLVLLALDPGRFVLFAPVVLLAVIAAAGYVAILVGNAREIVALVRSGKNRVIHGLEHATIKLLEEAGLRPFSGQTRDGYFELAVANEGRSSVLAIRLAVREAIGRIRAGEPDLAYDPRCGTSLLVALVVVSVIVLAGAVVGVIADVPANVVTAITGAIAAAGWFASRPLGLAAQRALTVSTRYRAVRIARVIRRISGDGGIARFEVDLVVDPVAAT